MLMELIPGLPDDIARQCFVRIHYKHFSKAATVCKAWRSDIQSGEFDRLRKTTGFSRTVVVLTQAELNRDSGSAKHPTTPVYHLTVYEPETGGWERVPPIPGHSEGLPLFCQCAGVGRFLVVVGGWEPMNWEVSNAVHVYDFLSGLWKRGTDMPGPARSFFACAADSEMMTVFVAGGHDEEKNALRSALAYDVAKDVWIPLGDMGRERDECKGIFHGGKFLVVGGYSSDRQGRFEGSVESFDIATWKWDRVEDGVLENGVCPKTCVMNEDGNMYTFAGNQVSLLSGETWKPMAEIPVDIRVGTNAVMWNGKVMVIGSTAYGGPNACYLLDGGKWIRRDSPEEFMGHVQCGCVLEI